MPIKCTVYNICKYIHILDINMHAYIHVYEGRHAYVCIYVYIYIHTKVTYIQRLHTYMLHAHESACMYV